MPSKSSSEALNHWLEKQSKDFPSPPFPGAVFDYSTRRWKKPATNLGALEDLKENFDAGKLSPDEAAKLITRWREDTSKNLQKMFATWLEKYFKK